MEFEVIHPKEGFKLSENEKKLIKAGYATTINAIHFPKENMPELLKGAASLREGLISLPELRIVTSRKSDARAMEYNTIRHRLNHYVIEGVDLVNWMIAVMDNPHSPLVTEIFFNPEDPGIQSVWQLMKTSPFVLCTLFIKDEYYQSRLFDNIFRERMVEIESVLQRKPQPKDVFMRAKRIFENTYPCDYKPYNDWSDHLQTIKVNWV